MKTDHLKEEALQQYTMGVLTDKGLLEHISNCKICMQQAAAYQFIVTGIESEAKPAFNFDLSAEVMAQIADHRFDQSYHRRDAIFGICVIMVLGFPLYLYRNILVSVFLGSSSTLLYAICTTGVSVFLWQGASQYLNYQRQMKALDISGRLQH